MNPLSWAASPFYFARKLWLLRYQNKICINFSYSIFFQTLEKVKYSLFSLVLSKHWFIWEVKVYQKIWGKFLLSCIYCIRPCKFIFLKKMFIYRDLLSQNQHWPKILQTCQMNIIIIKNPLLIHDKLIFRKKGRLSILAIITCHYRRAYDILTTATACFQLRRPG